MIISLDGRWQLAIDPDNQGREQAWFAQPPADALRAVDTVVPYPIQERFPGYHGVAWYWRTFDAPDIVHVEINGVSLLRFGAVDYLAEVWLNGVFVGGHEGGETPFTLDVTSAIRRGAANLLAVRVLNPTVERIDGIVLAETPHRNKAVPHYVGGMYNTGGIMESVELRIMPMIRIEDLHVQPDPATGIITTIIHVQNAHPVPQKVQITLLAEAAAGGGVVSLGGGALTPEPFPFEVSPGLSQITTALLIPHHKLWNLDDPQLYQVSVRVSGTVRATVVGVTTGFTIIDQRSVRFGFRDFRVVNGYFHLNGRRVFLRSTHTGNNTPVGQLVDPHEAPGLLRRDLLLAKTLGFNMVRFISGVAHPWQLDLCDEIGLMVYEESLAAWLLGDSPHMAARFDLSTREMILRDRNHPCITIWGMLNETKDGPVFKHAVASLALVRSLDVSRLVLLSSGRWDAHPSIGSVSNPGSAVWEHMWGGEAAGAADVPHTWSSGILAYIQDAGDVHAYPPAPHPPEVIRWLRTVGAASKPIFLSEYGIGSTLNAIREYRLYEQHGVNLEAEDAVLMRGMADQLIADWDRYDMAGAYAFPEDMLSDSQRLHARQRLVGFDAIRSNPQICGYNLTGMLDHGMTGEGAWTFWRELKPGIADALTDGWSPLRWCLFIEPMHVYSGRPFHIEAVLANEDVLAAGDYPACLRIVGRQGIVGEREVTVHIPAPSPGQMAALAVPVFVGDVTLYVPAGTYELAVNLMRGAAPAGGRLKFHVSEPALPLPAGRTVQHWGISEPVLTWLADHHVASDSLDDDTKPPASTILVGDLTAIETTDAQWERLLQRIAQGAVAIFLAPESLKHGEESLGRLRLSNRLSFTQFHDYLYHKECVAKPHAAFAGLSPAGIMDWDYYGPVIPSSLVIDTATPDEVAAAAFAVGYTCPGGYTSGLILAAYALGQGRIILSTLQLLEHIDAHPAADRLLLNLIEMAARTE